MSPFRQPWLHDLVAALQAPTVALSSPDGQLRPGGAQGVLHADVRVLSLALLTVDGSEPEPVAGGGTGASAARFTGLVRSLGDAGADPTVRVERSRRVAPGEVAEEISVLSYAHVPVRARVELALAADLARIEAVKSGRADDGGPGVAMDVANQASDDVLLRWSAGGVRAELRAGGPGVHATAGDSGGATVGWLVDLPSAGSTTLRWTLRAEVAAAPVRGAASPGYAWRDVRVDCADRRLSALAGQSLADLRALLMAPADAPDDVFPAAGAPWFFTLFGRDSLWTARLMLPFGWELAAGTLRALAARQGTRVDEETMQAPGKIPHELRQVASVHDDVGHSARTMRLPPLYYGTVDSTPLWVCVLHDAWRAGMPVEQVRALLPNLRAALGWLLDHGDADGDGFLEYLDTSGHGLANQGWKDSGDSIRFADGSQARGPIALCEVQGYAYEAAVHGADLLDAFGPSSGGADGGDRDGNDGKFAERLRGWAAELAARFRERFWTEDADGPFPALALDGAKRPVDALTSNIGHLLGTGLLNAAETALVLDRLTGPALDSGFGLRTMSARNRGYSPLSYHCGSVWPHDTAIVIRAMAVAGHGGRSLGLVDGLLAAAERFDWRLPELYGGDARADSPRPIPYPAACRPQAWAAASIGAITQALLGLEMDVPGGRVECRPVAPSPFGTLRVNGLVTVATERATPGAR
jgi:glycogen debranching enzyme